MILLVIYHLINCLKTQLTTSLTFKVSKKLRRVNIKLLYLCFNICYLILLQYVCMLNIDFSAGILKLCK